MPLTAHEHSDHLVYPLLSKVNQNHTNKISFLERYQDTDAGLSFIHLLIYLMPESLFWALESHHWTKQIERKKKENNLLPCRNYIRSIINNKLYSKLGGHSVIERKKWNKSKQNHTHQYVRGGQVSIWNRKLKVGSLWENYTYTWFERSWNQDFQEKYQ